MQLVDFPLTPNGANLNNPHTLTPASIPATATGLADKVNLENYTADLHKLAELIQHYTELTERQEAGTQAELLALLQRITRNLRNMAAIYTDSFQENLERTSEIQEQIRARLNYYPQAMADLQHRLLRLDQRLRQLNDTLAIQNAAIDRQVAFDPELKNDAQRVELIAADSDYTATTNALKDTQDQRENLLIELQLLRNQFSVLKLGMREAISYREMAVFDAA